MKHGIAEHGTHEVFVNGLRFGGERFSVLKKRLIKGFAIRISIEITFIGHYSKDDLICYPEANKMMETFEELNIEIKDKNNGEVSFAGRGFIREIEIMYPDDHVSEIKATIEIV